MLRGFSGGARRFLALDGGHVLVATARDPAIYEYAGAMRQATNEWASGGCCRAAWRGSGAAALRSDSRTLAIRGKVAAVSKRQPLAGDNGSH